MSASKSLNKYKPGKYGGRGPMDLNPPGHNHLKDQPDADHDGKDECSVSEELSEDSNAELVKED